MLLGFESFGGFPEMGVPPNHPFGIRIFRYKPSSFWGASIYGNPQIISGRRKFRSQTSDNMQRWKSRGGKSQRGEEKK